MGNGALAIGPKLPRPSSTLPELPTSALQRFRPESEGQLTFGGRDREDRSWHKAEDFGSATTSAAIGGTRDVPRQLAPCPFLTLAV